MTPEARWRLVLVGYVVAQMLARVLIGPSLELDEAEAFVHGQRLAWGYGPQPPLYFWLQWAFFQLLGDTILALAALKAVLLGGTLVLVLELMRRAVGTRAAGVATLSLALLPQVAWESQRALTNSVLALALAVAAALALLSALERGRRRDHVALGVIVGLGILGKVNMAVWAAGLVAAAVVLPRWRARLHPSRMLLAALAAALVLAGPLAWMVLNPDLATESADKFGLAPTGAWARLVGTGSLLLAILSFNALAPVVLGIAYAFGRLSGARPAVPPVIGLLALAVAASLLLVWIGVLASGATEVRDRWLLPVAWPLAPLAVAALWPMLTERARSALMGTVAALWVIAALALPYASLVDPGYRGSDWSAMEAVLRDEGAERLPVVVTHTWPAGNLLLRGEVPGLTFLARIEDLPGEALLLVAPSDAAALGDAAVLARTDTSRTIDVPRGDAVRSFAVLRLAPR